MNTGKKIRIAPLICVVSSRRLSRFLYHTFSTRIDVFGSAMLTTQKAVFFCIGYVEEMARNRL